MNRYTKFTQQSDTPRRPRPQIRLSDAELAAVMQVAKMLEPDKRQTLLERVAASLRRGDAGSFDDIVRRSLRGLLHEPGGDDATPIPQLEAYRRG